MHGNARLDLVLAVVEGDATGEHLAHHRDHIVGLERHAQRQVAHAAARGVGHLAVLQVIARAGKQIIVADVIVVHVADDDGRDLIRIDADLLQAFAHRLDQLALALLAHGRVKAGVENDRAGRPDDRPNIEVERLQHVVRIAADEVFRGLAIMMSVADGVNFVGVVAHSSSPSGTADGGR